MSNANRLRSYQRPNLAAVGDSSREVQTRVEVGRSSWDEDKNQEEEMATARVKDVVCGMEIDPKDAAATMEYQGKTYHFCSPACHDELMASPQDYDDVLQEITMVVLVWKVLAAPFVVCGIAAYLAGWAALLIRTTTLVSADF